MDTVKKVGVLCAGMMGAEIALCFAANGCSVVIKDSELSLAEKWVKAGIPTSPDT